MKFIFFVGNDFRVPLMALHGNDTLPRKRSLPWNLEACHCMPICNEAWHVHYARCAGMCLATYDGTWTYCMVTVIRPLKCVAHSVQVYVLLHFVYRDGTQGTDLNIYSWCIQGYCARHTHSFGNLISIKIVFYGMKIVRSYFQQFIVLNTTKSY